MEQLFYLISFIIKENNVETSQARQTLYLMALYKQTWTIIWAKP